MAQSMRAEQRRRRDAIVEPGPHRAPGSAEVGPLSHHVDGEVPDIPHLEAVRSDQRGKGLGGIFMKQIKELVEGDIALHVEADNPAKRLYEREGFTNPYLEMRWKRA